MMDQLAMSPSAAFTRHCVGCDREIEPGQLAVGYTEQPGLFHVNCRPPLGRKFEYPSKKRQFADSATGFLLWIASLCLAGLGGFVLGLLTR